MARKKQTHGAEAKAAKARSRAAKAPEGDMGAASEQPTDPISTLKPHTSARQMFHAKEVVSMARHDGGPNPALRNKVVVRLSDNTETIASQEDLAQVGIEAPAPLE